MRNRRLLRHGLSFFKNIWGRGCEQTFKSGQNHLTSAKFVLFQLLAMGIPLLFGDYLLISQETAKVPNSEIVEGALGQHC